MSAPRKMVKYWAWDYEIHKLGSWPSRSVYTGHNKPNEVYKAAEVEALLKQCREALKCFRTARTEIEFTLAMALADELLIHTLTPTPETREEKPNG